jgi:hypothetical protein
VIVVCHFVLYENSNNTTEKPEGNLSKITGKSVDTLTTSLTDLANNEIKQNGGDVVEQNGDHVKQNGRNIKQNGDTINIISEPSFTNKTYEMNESSIFVARCRFIQHQSKKEK